MIEDVDDRTVSSFVLRQQVVDVLEEKKSLLDEISRFIFFYFGLDRRFVTTTKATNARLIRDIRSVFSTLRKVRGAENEMETRSTYVASSGRDNTLGCLFLIHV